MRSTRRQMRLPRPNRQLLTLPARYPLSTTFSTSSSIQAANSIPQTTENAQYKPITSLLIANRGEIALRIHQTASRMGITTTTLFTNPDRHSQHANCSPHAISLGAPSAYLDGPRIISLARERGIQALHPGYGFLSENAAFATAVADAGMTFIGPPGSAMAAMGDKARSKQLMEAAGVPCVPGYHGSDQSAEFLAEQAQEIGYPVLLKSVRGGGGKGMRIVRSSEEFPAQLRSARHEAQASFGAGGEVMLVERYISRPRHVEVQVFADTHGNIVALGERDCSVQRRHQKILEESPAPGLSNELRHGLWEKAMDAARAVGYVGAGTVEFILDVESGEFFFMEMNTRLQVEHPVTEAVCGEDLVEWQLRVAAGETLPLTQDEVESRINGRGHAVEARIYAEIPERGFMPDSGKLVYLRTPKASTADPDAQVRIDTGFVEGDTVSEAYDGMITKLIVRGRDREEAIRKMDAALSDYKVVGPATNIEFLKRLCRSPAFVNGEVETGFIDKFKNELFGPHRVGDEVFVQAALGVIGTSKGQLHRGPHDGSPLGFAGPTERNFELRVLPADESGIGETVLITVAQKRHDLYSAKVSRPGVDEAVYDDLVCVSKAKKHGVRVTTFFPNSRVDSTLVRDTTADGRDRLTVFQLGGRTELTLPSPSWVVKTGAAIKVEGGVVAPMPCKVLRNEVEVGQKVEKGMPLVVIESMKMETVIRSPQDGVVKKLAHQEGDICKAGTVLVFFEDGGDDKP